MTDAPRERPTYNPREQIRWIVVVVVILVLTLVLMRNWLGDGLPTSERRESLTELAIVWMFRDELLQGEMLSEWNPFWFSGFPWLRFLSYPVYYVAAAASVWGGLSLESVMVLFYALAMAGSGLVMYGYLQQVLGDWRAALLGAVIYEAFPFHTHVGVETWIHLAFWAVLPLPLWTFESSLAADGLRRTNRLLFTGVALALYPIVSSEYAMLAAPFVGLYIVWRLVEQAVQGRQRWNVALGGLVLMGVVALGLATFFLLPAAMEVDQVGIHAKHAGGTTFTNELIRNYSVTPSLVWYAVAQRLGLPASLEGLPGVVRAFWSIAWYPGVIVPLLMLLGILTVARRPVARVALVNLVLSLLMLTGPTFALNVFGYLPVLGRLSPFRAMMLAIFFAATLAAMGMQWLTRHLSQWVPTDFPLRRWLPSVLVAGFAVLILLDFWPSSAAFQTTDAYYTPDQQAAFAWLRERQTSGRVWLVAELPRDQYLLTYSLSELPTPRYLGYYDNGAALHTWEQMAWTDMATTLALHQVRYVMVPVGNKVTEQLEPELRAAGYDVAWGQGNVRIWENPSRDEYARLYNSVILDATGDIAQSFEAVPLVVERGVALVAAENLPASERVVSTLDQYDHLLVSRDGTTRLHAEPDAPAVTGITVDALANLPPTQSMPRWIWATRESWSEIYVEVESSRSSVLTVAESWYPHWRVQVDDQPVTPLRVNWALLGVWIEPGVHRVRFYVQRPWYLYVGYLLTVLTVLGLVLWWVSYLAQLVNRPQISPEESLAMLRALHADEASSGED